ncbi:MAG: hypothetical protein AAF720_01385 [Pseudomonadota bacterium]
MSEPFFYRSEEGREKLREFLQLHLSLESIGTGAFTKQLVNSEEYKTEKVFESERERVRAALNRWLNDDNPREPFVRDKRDQERYLKRLECILRAHPSMSRLIQEDERRVDLIQKAKTLENVFLGNKSPYERAQFRQHIKKDLEGLHRVIAVGQRILEDGYAFDKRSSYLTRLYYHFHLPDELDCAIVKILATGELGLGDDNDVLYSGFAFIQQNNLDIIVADNSCNELRIHQTMEINSILDADYLVWRTNIEESWSNHGEAHALAFTTSNLIYSTESRFPRIISNYLTAGMESDAKNADRFETIDFRHLFCLHRVNEKSLKLNRLKAQLSSSIWDIVI